MTRPRCRECKTNFADAKEMGLFYCAKCWLKIFGDKGERNGINRSQVEGDKKNILS